MARIVGHDPITLHIPQTSLVRKYMRLTEGGEICPRFRFFVLIGALGATINRKVYLQRGTKETFPTLYPNPWIFLIAPQGRGHKSSAIYTGRKILEALPVEYRPTILAAKITPESLTKTLSSSTFAKENLDKHTLRIIRRKAIGTIISSELGTLLGKEKYLAGMAMFLTDIYDCHDEWASETIMRGDEKLYEICISIIAASTPDWMQTLLPRDAFEIGFMSRMVLVPLPKQWNVRKIPQGAPSGLFNEIVEEFVEYAQIQGEMKLASKTWEAYKDWYMNMPDLPPGPSKEYLERRQDHALRLAIILQLLEDKSLILQPETFWKAQEIFEAIQPDVEDLVSYIAMEPRMRIVKRIMQKITFEKEIFEDELLGDIWFLLGHPKEFDTVMELLLKTGQVTMEYVGSRVKYKLGKKKGE